MSVAMSHQINPSCKYAGRGVGYLDLGEVYVFKTIRTKWVKNYEMSRDK